MSNDVFISYSRKDSPFALKLKADLERQGIDVWIDQGDIVAGDAWRRQIVQGIDGCRVFLVVLSPSSTTSVNVVKELSIAESGRKKIIPILYRPVDIPEEMEYQLAGLQYQRFDQGAYEDNLACLAEVITSYLGRPPEDPPPPPPPRNNLIKLVLGIAGVGVFLLIGAVGAVLILVRSDATPTALALATTAVFPSTPTTPAPTTIVPLIAASVTTTPIPTRAPSTDTATTTPPPTLIPTRVPTVPATPTRVPTPKPPSTTASEQLIDGFENYSTAYLQENFKINKNAGNDLTLTFVGIPHVRQGSQGLAFQYNIRNAPPQDYVGFDRTLPNQDWTKFGRLCAWVESDGSGRSLVIQFGEGNNNFRKAYFQLTTQGGADFCLVLNTQPPINLAVIGYYGIYMEATSPGRGVIYIDNVRLVP